MSAKSSSPSPPLKPNLPFKIRLAISFLSFFTDASRRSDGTVNRRLLSLFDLRVPPNPRPVRTVRTLDLTVDPSRNLWLRLFLPSVPPSARLPLPVIVFFHGGGFVFLSPDNRTYDAVCRRLARKINAIIVSVNYRLAPEHRFPAPYDDGVDALRFIDNGGVDSLVGDIADFSSCFLAGDSAGANIVHHVARRWAAEGGWRKVGLRGLVLIQPFFGGEERTGSETELKDAYLVSVERTDWMWRAFLPEGADRDHAAANVFGGNDAGGIEEGFPPAMVVVGGFDPLKDRQRRYGEGLRERGREVEVVEFARSVHAFYVFPGMEDGVEMVEEMRKFVWRKMEKKKEKEEGEGGLVS